MTKRWQTAILAFAILATSSYAESISPSQFSKHLRIDLPGYSSATTQTNFPLLIKFKDGWNNFNFDEFESDDWSDLRFSVDGGTSSVPYEVESWNQKLTPSQIGGCQLWLAADSGVQTDASGAVTNWLDQSGHNNNAQADGTNASPALVTNVINGLPAVRYDGSRKYLLGSTNISAHTIFAVTKVDPNATSLAGLFNKAFGYDTENIRTVGGVWNADDNQGNSADFPENGEVIINGSPATEHNSKAHILMETSDSTDTFVYQLGQTFSYRFFYGDIYEFIVYDHILSEYERNIIGSYLEEKYALTATYGREAVVWVQIPALTTNTVIDAYWGNTNLTSIPSYTTNGTVWDSDYMAVWHLSEVAGARQDSSTNLRSGTPMNGVTNAGGIVGGSAMFDGSDDWLDIPNNFGQFTNKPFSVSFWVNADKMDNVGRIAFCAGGENNLFFTFADTQANDTLGIRVDDGAWKTPVRIDNLAAERWYHIAGTWSPTNGYKLYADGTLCSSSPLTNARSSRSKDNTLGSLDGDSRFLDGRMDEVRVSSIVRSPDWFKTSYENQANPDQFAVADASMWWDTSTNSGIQAGNGLWNTTNLTWSSSTNGSSPLLAWGFGVTAHFESASGLANIDVDYAQAAGMVFDGMLCTLTNGTIELGPKGIQTKSNASIYSKTVLAADQTWSVSSGSTQDQYGVISGAYTLTKTGDGTLVLNVVNSFSGGLTVDGGTVNFASPDQNAALPGGSTITINSGILDLINVNVSMNCDIVINPGGMLRCSGGHEHANYITMQGGTITGSGTGKYANQDILLDGGLYVRGTVPSTINVDNSFGLFGTRTFDVADVTGDTNVDLTVNSVISEGTLVKSGAGTLKITKQGTYTATSINSGTLLASANPGVSTTGPGTVTLNGGVLGGTGTVRAVVADVGGGLINPGEGVGTLRVSSVDFSANRGLSGLYVELNGENDYDQLLVTEGQTVLSNAYLTGEVNYTPASNAVLFIIINQTTNAISGNFVNTPQGERLSIGNYSFKVSYEADVSSSSLMGGHDVALYEPRHTTGGGTIDGPPYWRQISFPGYRGTSTLTNFPTLVLLHENLDGFSFKDFISDTGADLRFYSDTNKTTELNYEIESWNTNAGAYVWVQIPELSEGSSIWAYWGDSSLTNPPACTTNGAVWINGFAAVWHLNDTVTDEATGGTNSDATANGNDGTQYGCSLTNGMIAGAQNFDGSDYIDSAFSAALNTTNFSVSFWAKRTSGTGFGAAVSSRDDSPSRGYIIYSESGKWQFWSGIGTNGWEGTPQVYNDNGVWEHVTITYDGKDKKLYKNGVMVRCIPHTNHHINTTKPFRIGAGKNEGTADYYFTGQIDEVRVADSVRSSDWIWAAEQNQADPLTFMGESANVVYWDTDPGLGLQGGNGNWASTNALWSTDGLLGSNPLLFWTNSFSEAHFRAGGGGTITASSSISANRIIFDMPGYTLEGNGMQIQNGVVALEDVTLKPPFTVSAPQVWYVAEGKTLTVDGAGWNIAHTLVKRGKGTLRFINHKYSYCPDTLDIVVEEGQVRFDTGYWWNFDATDQMRIQVMPNGSLYTAYATFGFKQWPSDGSLEQMIIDGGTWTLGGNMGFPEGNYNELGRLLMRGGTISSGSLHPMRGMVVETKACDSTAVIGSSIGGHVNDAGWALTVADGVADPDVVVDGVIKSQVTSIAKNGTGKAVLTAANSQGATVINDGTLWLNNTTGSGAGTGNITISGGTLGGNGSIDGSIIFDNDGGTLAPGAPLGSLSAGGDVDFSTTNTASKSFVITLDSPTNDCSLVVGGNVTLDNAELELTINYQNLGDDKHFIIVNNGTNAVSGTFNGLPSGSMFRVPVTTGGSTPVQIYYAADEATQSLSGGNDVAVVLPASGLMILIH